MIFSTEKSLADYQDKLSETEKKDIEEAIKEAKEKLEKSTSAEDYNNATDELAKRAQKLGEILYKNMQEQQGSEGAQGFNPEDFAQQNNQNTQQKPGNDGPIDADYEVVDDK
jgi:molecular chaperone DnaK